MHKAIVIFFFICCFFNPITSHAQWLDDPASETHIHNGIGYIYNMAFDSARSEFHTVIKAHPENPAGHFFLAMVEWWTIMIDIENESHDEKFIAMLDRVIDLCDKRLEKDENDVPALFFKGGSMGFRGRLHANRGDWMKAANDGRNAMPIVQKMYKLDPKNYDILLGIGIYNYYAAVVPEQFPVVKPLMIFFPDGDKVKGIDQLRRASQHAQYANYEAAYFLLTIYQTYEKMYPEALALAMDLHAKFPANPVFHKYLGKAYVALGQWDKIYTTYTDMIERTKKKQFGYNLTMEREARYYLGLWEMNRKNYDAALSQLYRTDEICRSIDVKTPSPFMTMANLKIGMIYDKQSKRNYAIEQYKKVLEFNDYLDAHRLAEEYLSTPYNK
jgi:tetratricopeptide (TPR) repeat protein